MMSEDTLYISARGIAVACVNAFPDEDAAAPMPKVAEYVYGVAADDIRHFRPDRCNITYPSAAIVIADA